MPLPFLSTIIGGIGIKKRIDAKKDYELAQAINSQALAISENSKEKLEKTRDMTQLSLDLLTVRRSVLDGDLKSFVYTFEKIKNIDFNDPNLSVIPTVSFNRDELSSIKELTLEVGGIGIAIGMYALGGLIAAPYLLVSGIKMAAKAKEALADAYSNRDKARLESEAVDNVCSVANAIRLRANELYDLLTQLSTHFSDLSSRLEDLVSKNDDYRTYDQSEKKLVGQSAGFAKTVKVVLEAQIFDQDGEFTEQAKSILVNTREILDKAMDI